MALDKGILHFRPFAKYAVAFPGISRSISRTPAAHDKRTDVDSWIYPANCETGKARKLYTCIHCAARHAPVRRAFLLRQ